MNINPISFKGTYCLKSSDLIPKKARKIDSKEKKYSIISQTGGYTSSDKTYMTVPYNMENKFVKMLNKLSLSYEKINEAEALDCDNIVSRMIATPYNSNTILLNINTEKLDNELKKDKESYIGEKGENGIEDRYEKFKNFLRTNQQIIAPDVYVYKSAESEIETGIKDGRHRFAVLRDLGIENIPVSIDRKSIEAAREIGLI